MAAFHVGGISRKGGSGKTAGTVLLTRELVRHGYNVLFIDLDAQASNASASLGVDTHGELPYSVADLFAGKKPFAPIPVIPGRLDVVPANQRQVWIVEFKLMQMHQQQVAAWNATGRTTPRPGHGLLASRLRAVEAPYDFVVLDCPTALGETTCQALEAMDVALSPIDLSSRKNVQSVSDLREQIGLLTKKPMVRYFGNKWKEKEIACQEAWSDAKELCGGELHQTRLPDSAAIRQALADGRPIHVYASRAAAAVEAVWTLGQMVMSMSTAPAPAV